MAIRSLPSWHVIRLGPGLVYDGGVALVVPQPQGMLVDLSVSAAGGTTQNLAATSAGASAATGTLTYIASLAATHAGVATVTAALNYIAALSSTSTGVGTMTGTLPGLVNLAASSAGMSSATAALTAIYGLIASSSGVATATAALNYIAALNGSTAGAGTMTGAFTLPDFFVRSLRTAILAAENTSTVVLHDTDTTTEIVE